MATGDFLASEAYVLLWKSIWFSHIPASAKVCHWKDSLGIFPTVDNLFAKEVFVEHETCSLCHSASETVLHLSSQCPYTRSIFQSLPGMAEVCYPSNRTFSDFFE